MNPQKLIISNDIHQSLTQAMSEIVYDRLFILCDETTRRLCLPIIMDEGQRSKVEGWRSKVEGWRSKVITIPAGDTNKTLESVSHVWQELQRGGATRHSLIINLGGGMVTDLGGFAASTFKRGIHFINIPTTLLAMVDASVGGKTGINFGGLKNEIGVFRNADSVILDTTFLHTLDAENMLSGYAEMLKHGLIDSEEHWAALMDCPIEAIETIDIKALLEKSVAVKQRIVLEDPTEQGIRKALNLGHTAGHAFESFAMRRKPVLHGYAVAWGLVVELYLSVTKAGFPTDRMRQTVSFIKEHYGKLPFTCKDYAEMVELMHHDKKNTGQTINFTLLGGIGDIRINQTATEEEIKEALDFYQDC